MLQNLFIINHKKFMPKCKHKNIIMTNKSYYSIPEGFNKLLDIVDEKDFDISEYLRKQEQSSIFCEDCGEYLDD